MGRHPGFARTAYSMQGRTLHAGMVDLNLRDQADPVTGYVAMSRFKKAEDVLILQAFDLSVFQQGIADQPKLLLERLRNLHKPISELLADYEQKLKVQGDEKKRQMEDRKRERAEKARASRVQAALRMTAGLTPEAKKRKAGEGMAPEAKRRKSGEGKARKPGMTRKPRNPFTCTECQEEKGANQYDEWVWRTRHENTKHGQRVLCLSCAAR